MGYRKIAQWLNENGYTTPRGHEFKNTHVFSILKKKKCKTEKLKLAGYKKIVDWNDPMHVYGSQKKKVESLGGIDDNKSLSKKFHITNNIIEW